MNAIAPIQDTDPRDAGERMPSNLEAEQALLGAALFDNSAVGLVDDVRPEHFYEPFHARLWTAILSRVNKGQLAEPIELQSSFFAEDVAYHELGGLRYLADLLDRAPPAPNAPTYARAIIDNALRRELIAAGTAISFAARKTPEPAIDQLATAEKALAELAHHGGAPSAWLGAGSVVAKALDEARTRKGMVGLSTGLSELDDAIGGLRKGQMILIGGRPGMAKSTAGLNIAKAVARKGMGVIFYSMEMPAFDLGLRLACDVAHDPLAMRYNGVSSNPRYFDAARGRLTDEQWWTLDQAREDVGNWPLLFDERPGLTVATMLAQARRQFRTWERKGVEPGCIIIDHLTIAKPDQARNGNKVAEISDISRAIAEMAKTLDIPVIALCQLSRDVEKRNGGAGDKRPTLSDLRWSGDLEQDARLVAFLYRPEYYLREPEDTNDFEAMSEYREKLDKVRNKLFWLVEKNNNGPTGQVETYCDVTCSAIRDKLGARNG